MSHSQRKIPLQNNFSATIKQINMQMNRVKCYIPSYVGTPKYLQTQRALLGYRYKLDCFQQRRFTHITIPSYSLTVNDHRAITGGQTVSTEF